MNGLPSSDERKERRGENRRAISQLEQSGEQLRNKRRRDYKVETHGLNENLAAGKKFQFKLDSTGWRDTRGSRGCSLFFSLDPSAIFRALDVAMVSQKFRNTG
jgi:hypothetical protein